METRELKVQVEFIIPVENSQKFVHQLLPENLRKYFEPYGMHFDNATKVTYFLHTTNHCNPKIMQNAVLNDDAWAGISSGHSATNTYPSSMFCALYVQCEITVSLSITHLDLNRKKLHTLLDDFFVEYLPKPKYPIAVGFNEVWTFSNDCTFFYSCPSDSHRVLLHTILPGHLPRPFNRTLMAFHRQINTQCHGLCTQTFQAWPKLVFLKDSLTKPIYEFREKYAKTYQLNVDWPTICGTLYPIKNDLFVSLFLDVENEEDIHPLIKIDDVPQAANADQVVKSTNDGVLHQKLWRLQQELDFYKLQYQQTLDALNKRSKQVRAPKTFVFDTQFL